MENLELKIKNVSKPKLLKMLGDITAYCVKLKKAVKR
jgi:hypothetical protein